MKYLKKNIKYTDVMLLLAFLLAGLIFLIFFRIPVVKGDSMETTLKDGQHLILSTRAYMFSEPERGDIIVAQPHKLNGEYIIKRLIGLPGDRIEIKDNTLYLNGKAVEEDYLAEPMKSADMEMEVSEGCVFVMGDNRNVSGDSRSEYIGCLSLSEEIEGKIIFAFSF